MNNIDNFTNLYSLSKTLRFELKPIGKTAETFEQWLKEVKSSEPVADKDNNLFAKDEKIKEAYLSIKPIMDKQHEQFIERSLTSDEAKGIDFSQYFEAYREKNVSDKLEKGLREQIGNTYQEAGKYFSEKISKVLDKEFTAKKEKPYVCLTDAKMLNYLSANIKELAKQNGIDEKELVNHLEQFKGFWGYLGGYNTNRENYYITDKEASTAVATRIVHENLPTFCNNALRFEKRKEEYLDIYRYLKDNNRETKIKIAQGEEIEAEPITETIFQIEHFNKCIAQSQIEEYNRIIGHYNYLINLYNQARREETGFKKIDEFEKLYKQIGCGKKKTMFAALIKDKEADLTQEEKNKEGIFTVEKLLQKAKDAGNGMFKNGSNETEIDTLPAFIKFLKECDNWDGIYMSSTAVNKISNLYFANWHSIKDKLLDWYNGKDKELKEKAKTCITYEKKREEPIKLRDAVELSGLFGVLDADAEQSEHVFKASLFKDDETNEYRGVLDKALTPSKNLINLLCFDIERNINEFLQGSNSGFALDKHKDENNESGEDKYGDFVPWKYDEEKNNQSGKANQAGKKDNTIENIKNWFDAATDAMRIVRYFAVRKSKMKGNLPNVTMEQALSNLLYSDEAQWFKWYDLIRNYLTKKPQDDAKENKLKLNFDSSSFLKESGWDNDYSKNGAFIVIKGNDYYLVVVNDKLEEDDINKLKTSSNNTAKRLIYKQQKMDFKNFPRLFIFSKGDNLAPAVEKYKLPIETILKDYKKYRELSQKGKESFIKEHPKFRSNLIEYFKKCALVHESLLPFKDMLEIVWRKTDDYNTLSEFYSDTINACYEITFENIDFEKLCSMDKFYLFQIYNKDFSIGKDGGNGSTGKSNMHTIYWKMLFDETNLKDVIFKLDGQGAEIFMREPVTNESPVKHRVGSKMVNKRDKDGNTIPEQIYREIYSFVNDKTEKISKEAQKYIDEQKAIIKNVKHEIIKDKRFYDKTKYLFHCPITINFKARNFSSQDIAKGIAFSVVNPQITDALQQSDNLQFIGIDRGEKHLVYSCTIDKNGKIIKCKHHDIISVTTKDKEGKNIEHKTDYVQKLEAVADERIIAKKNWQAQNKIKDLKSGYISHVVHRLVEETIKDGEKIAPHAYIVLEDLNTKMKRGRQKIEKQVYQNLETALAKKLNFVVDKNAKQGELGSVSKALQLTPPISNYQDIEGKKQFGVMLYTRANYTSVTDPATGWRKTIYIKNGKEEDIKKQILEKFSDFGFDGKDYYFEYTEDHAGHPWRLYSGKNGESLPRFQNRKQLQQDKNIWVPEQINVVEILDQLFANFDKTKSFKAQVENGVELKKIDVRSETAWQSLRYALDLIQQIRNSGEKNSKDDNFLYSPVRDNKNDEHFDTRNFANNGDLSEIVDADANGAYNIARKGLIMDAHIKHWMKSGQPKMRNDGKEASDLDLFISDKEWDLWLLDREQWEKELPRFASRSAKGDND